MNFVAVWLSGLAGIAVLLTLAWLLSLRLKDASIVDIFWGMCFMTAAVVYAASTPDGDPARKALSLIAVLAWSARLSLHIGVRNWGKPEDYRYAAWRKQYGDAWWWRSALQVFALQGVLAWLISLPVAAAQYSTAPAGWIDAVAMVIWAAGFLFEAIGDAQLSAFRRDPANAGKVMQAGLWRYTRHPNYFGDAVQWWGQFGLALSAGGWWTVGAPILMTYLLLRVSGVAMLERTIKERRPEYAEYVRRTSAFIPRPPRS